MGGFSFGLGGGRSAHFDTWRSDGSSSSGSTARGESRHGRRSRRDRSPSMSPIRGLDSQFTRMMSDTFPDRMSSGSGMPSMFRGMSSMLGSDFPSSAFSGLPGMPRGRRMSRSPSFDSDRDTIRLDGFSPFDSEMDTVRPGSAYSGFPGMPAGMASSGYHTGGSCFTERSDPFFMRRTDSYSPASGSRRRRSPSPPVTSYSRGYRTTGRAPESTYAPQSTYAPRGGRSPSPHGYNSSNYSSYTTRASSPPRRRRSPSPPPRRQRSPSPLGRNHGRSRRRSPSPSAFRHGASSHADSARGFRTTERKPEGASSRAGGSSSHERSRSGAEQPSGGQDNRGYSTTGSYSHGTSQGTSHNAYNARPMPSRSQSSSRPQHDGRQSRQQRARSPPPQPRGNTRDSARTRSASNASPATAKPTRSPAELKKIFDAYNTAWESLSRHDKNYPLPATFRDLSNLNFAGGSSANAGKWTAEQILTANVQLIFLAGFGLSGSLNTRGDSIRVQVETRGHQTEELQALAKWLSRKEQPRWHPDRMNARTGKVGVLDEGISKKRDVVAMRSAAQELLGNVSQ